MELLSVMSEMRAPLFAVTGRAELILRDGYGEVSDEVRDAVQRIIHGGQQAEELIGATFDRVLKRRRTVNDPAAP